MFTCDEEIRIICASRPNLGSKTVVERSEMAQRGNRVLAVVMWIVATKI